MRTGFPNIQVVQYASTVLVVVIIAWVLWFAYRSLMDTKETFATVNCVHSAEKGACKGSTETPFVKVECSYYTSTGVSSITSMLFQVPESKTSVSYDLRGKTYVKDMYSTVMPTGFTITGIKGVAGYSTTLEKVYNPVFNNRQYNKSGVNPELVKISETTVTKLTDTKNNSPILDKITLTITRTTASGPKAAPVVASTGLTRAEVEEMIQDALPEPITREYIVDVVQSELLMDATKEYIVDVLKESLTNITNDMKKMKEEMNQMITNGMTQVRSEIDKSVTQMRAEANQVRTELNTAKSDFAKEVGKLTGQIAYFPNPTAPEGWLMCNGSTVSRSTYAGLFNVIGTRYGAGDGRTTFTLPDLRGEFIRCLDNGRNLDPGRGLGSVQGDAIRNITGYIGPISETFCATGPSQGGALYKVSGGPNGANTPQHVDWTCGGTMGFDAARSVPTANENRPRNIALLACIKY